MEVGVAGKWSMPSAAAVVAVQGTDTGTDTGTETGTGTGTWIGVIAGGRIGAEIGDGGSLRTQQQQQQQKVEGAAEGVGLVRGSEMMRWRLV
jgi:hypothetical protein